MCIRDRWQTTFYEKRYSQTDPHRRTDFVKLAEGFGLKEMCIRDRPRSSRSGRNSPKRASSWWPSAFDFLTTSSAACGGSFLSK